VRRIAAAVWLLALCAALGYLGLRIEQGVALQSNVLALLPHAEQDETLQRAEDRVANAFARRIVLLVGHRDAATAHAAGRDVADALGRSGLASTVTAIVDADTQLRLGAAYFPYRAGLLAARDRTLLEDGKAETLVKRALAAIYGPGGIADSRLLTRDPFLLMPSFFASLPLPQSRLAPEEGILTVHDGETTYAFIAAELAGDPFSVRFQDRLDRFLADEIGALSARWPDLRVLRTGAVFYATESSHEAAAETSSIGLASTIGTVALVLAVFRAIRPLLLSLLAIAIGILFAIAATLLIFGQLHAIALLFGVSLIGVSVDYCLQYFCEYFDQEAQSATARLDRVLAGVILGLATTLIGYLTLLLAPFPGLQQVATFSVCGLAASVLTVALWYPLLDRGGPVAHGARLVAAAGQHWRFWQAPGSRWARLVAVLVCLCLGIAGAAAVEVDDDVRHLQSLSPLLHAQEEQIQRLTGASGSVQFLLIQGDSEQGMLETEEALAAPLNTAIGEGALSGFQSVAQFVPSIARQKADRALVQDRLYGPHLAPYLAQIGLDVAPEPAVDAPYLTLAGLPKEGPLALVGALVVAEGAQPVHLMSLQGVRDVAALRALVDHPPIDHPGARSGVRLISPAEDYSLLFGKYRREAIGLIALSALLMLPMLIWRYGFAGALRVIAPSLAALVLAPPIAALFGVRFTFFNAMALVLVLSIGTDYAVFCRESRGLRKPVTMLAVLLAALSTILSFGLLALSRVFAVHAFGTTMLIGIALAFLLAPAAGDGESKPPRRLAIFRAQ
jgi:predicted exporter